MHKKAAKLANQMVASLVAKRVDKRAKYEEVVMLAAYLVDSMAEMTVV